MPAKITCALTDTFKTGSLSEEYAVYISVSSGDSSLSVPFITSLAAAIDFTAQLAGVVAEGLKLRAPRAVEQALTEGPRGDAKEG